MFKVMFQIITNIIGKKICEQTIKITDIFHIQPWNLSQSIFLIIELMKVRYNDDSYCFRWNFPFCEKKTFLFLLWKARLKVCKSCIVFFILIISHRLSLSDRLQLSGINCKLSLILNF